MQGVTETDGRPVHGGRQRMELRQRRPDIGQRGGDDGGVVNNMSRIVRLVESTTGDEAVDNGEHVGQRERGCSGNTGTVDVDVCTKNHCLDEGGCALGWR